MSRITYRAWNPQADARRMIEQANDICAELAAQGYNLTLRQLHYQFVARGLMANTTKNYNRLGDVVNRARLAGMMDWDYIEDRTRSIEGRMYFEKPGDAVLRAARNYSEDLWATQPLRVEVWVEKQALADIVGRVAKTHDVDSFACRGYVSQSELWSAGQRLLNYIERGQRVLILHLGDHDPSGIDMTRDIRDRLELFIERDYHRNHIGAGAGQLGRTTTLGTIRRHMREQVGRESPLEVRRIALTMEQIEQYGPPPNPARITDTRATKYIEEYGDESWELDALEPSVISELIESHIVVERDDDKWFPAVEKEETNRGNMVRVAERWDELVAATTKGQK